MLELDDATFESTIKGSDIPVIVDFSATWCGPCQRLKPIIEELSNEYDGKVKIAKLDIDSSPNTPTAFGIMSVPTILFFKDGEKVDQSIGLQSKDSLKKKIDGLIG